MKNIIALLAIVISNLFIMAGCSQDQPKRSGKEQVIHQVDNQKDGQVKDDLAKYLSTMELAMKPWSKIDKLKEELKAAKSAKGYTSLLRDEFVPIVTGIVTQVDAIKPATKEVQAIHDAYKSSLKDYLSGLQSMADAVEKNDNTLVNESAVKLNAIEVARAKFLGETKTLAATTNNIIPK